MQLDSVSQITGLDLRGREAPPYPPPVLIGRAPSPAPTLRQRPVKNPPTSSLLPALRPLAMCICRLSPSPASPLPPSPPSDASSFMLVGPGNPAHGAPLCRNLHPLPGNPAPGDRIGPPRGRRAGFTVHMQLGPDPGQTGPTWSGQETLPLAVGSGLRDPDFRPLRIPTPCQGNTKDLSING